MLSKPQHLHDMLMKFISMISYNERFMMVMIDMIDCIKTTLSITSFHSAHGQKINITSDHIKCTHGERREKEGGRGTSLCG